MRQLNRDKTLNKKNNKNLNVENAQKLLQDMKLHKLNQEYFFLTFIRN